MKTLFDDTQLGLSPLAAGERAVSQPGRPDANCHGGCHRDTLFKSPRQRPTSCHAVGCGRYTVRVGTIQSWRKSVVSETVYADATVQSVEARLVESWKSPCAKRKPAFQCW